MKYKTQDYTDSWHEAMVTNNGDGINRLTCDNKDAADRVLSTPSHIRPEEAEVDLLLQPIVPLLPAIAVGANYLISNLINPP